MNRREVLLAVLVGLVLSGMACADMMPVDRSVVGPDKVLHESAGTNPERSSDLSLLSPVNTITDLDLGTEASLKDIISEPGQAADIQGNHCVMTETSSFNLCLYGLLGMGLFHCGPWIKRVSLGIIPDWYHDEGPQQIGHSYAVLPGSQYSLTICCFVQPVYSAQDLAPQFHRETLASLLCKSQSTPTHLAGRGPPSLT